MINIQCPHCQTNYQLSSALAGRKVLCQFCKEKFRLPDAASQSDAIKRISEDLAESSGKMTRIETRCPRCLADYKLKSSYAGKSVRCRDCKTIFDVPTAENRSSPRFDSAMNSVESEDLDEELLDITPPPMQAFRSEPKKSVNRPKFTPWTTEEPVRQSASSHDSESYSLLDFQGDQATGSLDLDDDDEACDDQWQVKRSNFQRNQKNVARTAYQNVSKRKSQKSGFDFSVVLPVLKKMGSVLLILIVITARMLRNERRREKLAELFNGPQQNAPANPVSSNGGDQDLQSAQAALIPAGTSIPEDVDDVTRGLAMLDSNDISQRQQGLKILLKAEFDGRDQLVLSKMTHALIRNQGNVSILADIFLVIDRCQLPEVPSLLANQFKNSWLRPAIKPILIRRKDPSCIQPLADFFMYDTSLDIDEVFIALGPVAEDAVLKIIQDHPGRLDKLDRLSNILAKIGTEKSIPTLRQVSENMFPPVRIAATNALLAIEKRLAD